MRKFLANFNLSAFTLAEVLITLGIIGVVAAMTIPTLVVNSQKNQTITQLKKSYSTLSNLIQTLRTEEGALTGWGFTEWGNTTGMVNIYNNMIAPKLKIAKYCGTANTNDGCWASTGYNIDGSDAAPVLYGVYAVLADGTSVVFVDDCDFGNNSYILRILVDLNGVKKPNRWGKDRFSFVTSEGATSKALFPFGGGNRWATDTPNGRTACWTNDGSSAWLFPGTGLTCAYTIIMLDNWQIADDYPF